MEDIEKDWNKVAKSSEKAGYRDGISDGRESNYQKHFDEGYKEGFKNGFTLGRIKGIVSATALSDKEPLVLTEELQKTRLGCCQMCKDEELLRKPKENVINIQSTCVNNTVNDLMKSYSGLSDLFNKSDEI